MKLSTNRLSRRSLFEVLGVIVLGFSQRTFAESPAPTNSQIYRLTRIRIPPLSSHRTDKDLNRPPTIYIILLKNGKQIGDCSDAMHGWEVEFADEEQNRWEITENVGDSYLLQVWDSQWRGDNLICSIANLNAQSFKAPILEEMGQGKAEDASTKIEFVRFTIEANGN